MVILFDTILLVYGKVNFTNLSPYSSLSEKTYPRHFLNNFDLSEFHQYLCSLINKRGKKTEEKATF